MFLQAIDPTQPAPVGERPTQLPFLAAPGVTQRRNHPEARHPLTLTRQDQPCEGEPLPAQPRRARERLHPRGEIDRQIVVAPVLLDVEHRAATRMGARRQHPHPLLDEAIAHPHQPSCGVTQRRLDDDHAPARRQPPHGVLQSPNTAPVASLLPPLPGLPAFASDLLNSQ